TIPRRFMPCTSQCQKASRHLSVRRDLGNFRSLDTHSSHKTFLTEYIGINSLLQRGRGEVFAETFVQDHQARSTSEFPSVAFLQIIERIVVHEEQYVAE